MMLHLLTNFSIDYNERLKKFMLNLFYLQMLLCYNTTIRWFQVKVKNIFQQKIPKKPQINIHSVLIMNQD